MIALHMNPEIYPAGPSPRRRFLRGALLATYLVASQCWSPRAFARTRLVFAVVPYLPARRLVALYAPLVPVIEATLGQPVDIVSAPDYEQHIARMRQGAYDIVADSLLLARIAERELGHLPVARTRAALEPLLVVPAQARIATLDALRGGAVAVTDRQAAVSVLGLHHLRDRGLVPDRDVRVVTTGSHLNSLHRLLAGEVTAAITSRTTHKQIDPALVQQVRVLEILPKGLSAVVYHVVPRLAAQAAALSAALIDFAENQPAGRSFIASLGHEGLLPVTDAEMKALDPLVIEHYRQSGARGS